MEAEPGRKGTARPALRPPAVFRRRGGRGCGPPLPGMPPRGRKAPSLPGSSRHFFDGRSELVDPPESAAPIDANEDFLGYRRRSARSCSRSSPLPGVVRGGEEHAVLNSRAQISRRPANSLPLSNVILCRSRRSRTADDLGVTTSAPWSAPTQCESPPPVSRDSPSRPRTTRSPSQCPTLMRSPPRRGVSIPRRRDHAPPALLTGQAACACASRAPDASKGRLPPRVCVHACRSSPCTRARPSVRPACRSPRRPPLPSPPRHAEPLR